MSHTVILGAGMTGLGAALRLAEAGQRVTVVERLPYVGGLAATLQFDRFRFDQGPHGFHSNSPETLAAFQDLGRGELKGYAKNLHVNFRGRLYRYPLRPGDMLRTLPPVTGALCLADYFSTAISRRLNHRTDKSMEDWVVNRFGHTLYDIFFGPYTQKVWGIHPSRLDPSFGKYRIPHVNLWSLITKSFASGAKRLTGKEHRLSPLVLEFFYHPRGSGAVPDEMARRVRASGGQILLNTEVTGVRLANGQASSVSVRSPDGRQEEIDCEFVVSSIPLPALCDMLQPAPDSEVLTVARRLRMRSVLVICLAVARPQVISVQSVYYSNKTFNRLSDLRQWGGYEMCPDDTSCLTAEMTCDLGDHFWNTSDDELCGLIVEELEEEGILRRDEVIHQSVIRLGDHYPVYELNYEARLRVLAEFFRQVPNLVTGGRQGLFKYIDMNIALESGFEMAQHIVSGADKPPLDGPVEERLFV